MRKLYFHCVLSCISLILILMSPIVSAGGAATPFSTIVFFGDSLSDNGNFFSDAYGYMPKSPPYFDGRFTNGKVWSEYAADYYLTNHNVTSTNYALGGQTAIFHNPVKGFLPYTLTLSRDDYLIRSMFSDRTTTMFVIWIGANDYLSGISDVDSLTTDVIDSIKDTLESLIYHGGKNFLLVNLPDLSRTPYGNKGALSVDIQAAVIAHNVKLAAMLSDVEQEYKDTNIHMFDIKTLLDQFIDDPDAFNTKFSTHIVNTTASCWQGGYTLRPHQVTEESIAQQIEKHLQSKSRSFAARNPNKLNVEGLAHYIAATPALLETYKVSEHTLLGEKPCSDPDDYMFWDSVHPTAVIHQVLGANLIDFIKLNYQPVKIPD